MLNLKVDPVTFLSALGVDINDVEVKGFVGESTIFVMVVALVSLYTTLVFAKVGPSKYRAHEKETREVDGGSATV